MGYVAGTDERVRWWLGRRPAAGARDLGRKHSINTSKQQYIVNCATGLLAQLATAACGIVLVPFALRHMGTELFGTYQLGRSIIVMLSLLQAGMGPTLVRFCAQAIAGGDRGRIREISGSSLLVLIVLGGIAMGVSLLLIPLFIRTYCGGDAVLGRDASGYLVLLSVSLFLNIVSLAPQGLLLGANQYGRDNLVTIGDQVLRLVLIMAAFHVCTPSLTLMGAAFMVSSTVRSGILFRMAKTLRGADGLFAVQAATRSMGLAFLGFGSLTFAGTLAGAAIAQGPTLIMGRYLGTAAVAALAPVLLVSTSMQQFLSNLAKPLVPVASKLRQAHRDEELGTVSVAVSQVLTVAGLTLVVPLVLYGEGWTALWLGGGFAWTWKMIAGLAAATALSQSQFANYYLALGGGDIRRLVYSQILLAVCICGGLAAGFAHYDWKVAHAVAYVAAAKCLRNVVYLPAAYASELHFGVVGYMIKVYAVPVVLATGCVVGAWQIFGAAETPAQLVLKSAGVSGGYLLLCGLLLLSPGQRRSVTRLLVSALTGAGKANS